MKVCMVYDVKGWAWHHKAKAIQKYLNDEFDKITIVSLKEFHKGLFAKYHTMHMFGWLDKKGLIGKYKGHTAGVSSHNFIYRHPEKAKKYLRKYGALTANSRIIEKELRDRHLNDKIYYTPNGVDETIFFPEPIEHDKFTIGWMGQPSGKGLTRESGIDMHGYHHILLPLVESLKDEKDIEFKIMAKTHSNAIPFSEMPKFYNGLDLFVATPFGIGTPNPAFEAQACGIPLIGTAIGAMPQLLETEENGVLLPRYFNKEQAQETVRRFKEEILFLKNNRERLKSMSEAARRIIEANWQWRDRAKNWLPVFRNHKKKI